ncbi:hypothetical protein J7K19_12915 [bacterium]|nr:hypothetical protein [bacterium]
MEFLRQQWSGITNAWENSLGHQLKELPSFSYVYDEVTKQVREYETNRNS